ncbi:uncharacterized protein EDB91DRAFT_1255459 [Suillus paluster]|uniref:uncharacterized protein n=1 Tax=Suillus paluster TaxID=48578 RepID=UPI001B86A993|nr:uncharacterized protein EDB91DRAFT_1255459 [Suillus paluster]KAG1723908.1 hypothetical protein EDB91DRAFT_1255459 [Suillus paluster]
MHTCPECGLDVALANKLQKSFAWIPPLVADSNDDEYFTGSESITDEELMEECASGSSTQVVSDSVLDILEGGIIDWSELERVDKGIMPTGFIEEINILN